MLPEMLCRQDVERGTLVPVLPGHIGRVGHLWAVMPSTRHVSPKVRVFLDLLTSNLSTLLPNA